MSLVLDFKHLIDIEAKPDLVWAFVWDVQAMARCLLGCEAVVTQVEGKSYTARVRRKIAAFSIGFELDITVVGSQPNRFVSLEVLGKDKRLRSEIHQNLTASLSSLGPSQSEIEIVTTVRVSGLLASLGKNLVSMQFVQILDEFAANLRTAIESCTCQPIPSEPTEGPAIVLPKTGG